MATSVLPSLKSRLHLNPLSTNPTKWSNTLKQFVGNLPTNCLGVFDHFMNLAFKWLNLQLKDSNSNLLTLGIQKKADKAVLIKTGVT